MNGTTPELIYGKVPLKMIGLADRALIRRLGFESYLEIAVKATMKDLEKRQEVNGCSCKRDY